MSCPVCNHTMQAIGGANKVFHCPRCGTLKDQGKRDRAGLPEEIEEGGDDLGVSEPTLVAKAFRVHQEALSYIANNKGTHAILDSERLEIAINNAEECIGNPS